MIGFTTATNAFTYCSAGKASKTTISVFIASIARWGYRYVCIRPRRNKSAQRRQPQTTAVAINDVWSMDFVMDQLYDGRRLRALTVVDNYTRECLAIEIGQNLRGEDVVRTLDDICRTRDKPCSTTVANLFRRPLIAGPMSIASNWISVVRVNLPTMRNANRSMVGSDKSA